jgi:hypothetical protein
MNLQRSDLPSLLAAHKSLSGDFEPKTRYNIGRNTIHLVRAMKAVDAERSALVRKHNPGADNITPDHANWAGFVEDFTAFMQKEAIVDLRHLSFDGLNLDKNQIDPNALAALDRVLAMPEDATLVPPGLVVPFGNNG